MGKNENRDHDYQLRDYDRDSLPYPRIEFFKKIPIYSLPLEWNLIGDLTFQRNKILFRNLLRESCLVTFLTIKLR